MENRRLLLAAFLSVLVISLWQSVVAPPPPVPEDVPTIVDETGAAPRLAPPEEETTPGGIAPEEPPEAPEAISGFAEEPIEAELEERTVLESDGIRAEFTNRGAQLVSFLLLQHQSSQGGPLELVRERGSDPYPFSLVVEGEKSHRLNKALFEWEREVDPEGRPTLRFRHQSELGAAEKVFHLTPEGFLGVEISLAETRDWSVVLGPGARNLTAEEADDRLLNRGVGYRRGDELELINPEGQEEDIFIPGVGLSWIASEDKFFLTAAVPRRGVREALIRPILQRNEFDSDLPRFLPVDAVVDEDSVQEEQLLLIGASGGTLEMLTFFGDKRYSRLASLPGGLEETVRWGWFGFLVKPLYFGLDWIYRELVPNYGWGIILITFLIRLAFFPLTWKSQQSMSKMQELNPKVQAIKARYRSKLKDRQGRPNLEAQRQMNEETMAVFKNAGVNPASGCLPILLQAPVFFAFFRLLSNAVELRNAPWIGWIQDLSVPDPNWVLPILMGVTSIALQKMMPQPPDPMQRKLMQVMPLMFVVFAFGFPSGLVLYWVTSNLLTMAQQAVMKKTRAKDEAAAKAKPAG